MSSGVQILGGMQAFLWLLIPDLLHSKYITMVIGSILLVIQLIKTAMPIQSENSPSQPPSTVLTPSASSQTRASKGSFVKELA
jgi:hypothetical protein